MEGIRELGRQEWRAVAPTNKSREIWDNNLVFGTLRGNLVFGTLRGLTWYLVTRKAGILGAGEMRVAGSSASGALGPTWWLRAAAACTNEWT